MYEPHLFEGANYYRSKIFRSAAECTMRSQTYISQEPCGKYTLKSIPFCKVCSNHIIAEIIGRDHFHIGELEFINCPIYLGNKIESVVGKMFYNYIIETKNDFISLNCFVVTLRRFERFFKEKLRWMTFAKPIDLGISAQEEEKWGGKQIEFPTINLKSWRMFILCMNRLKIINDIYGKENGIKGPRYIGGGLSGVLQYGSFGRIENKYQLTSFSIDKISFDKVINTNFEDFDNLCEGSLLQFWPSENTYKLIVAYILGRIDIDLLISEAIVDTSVGDLYQRKPEWKPKINNGEPDITNFCLVYMGRNIDNKHIIADNTGVDILLSDWQENFKFCIAAQWYDAHNPVK
jgi:hypothetical protein